QDYCRSHAHQARLGEHLSGWRQQFAQRAALRQESLAQQQALQALQRQAQQAQQDAQATAARIAPALQAHAEAAAALRAAQAALPAEDSGALRARWQQLQAQAHGWQGVLERARERQLREQQLQGLAQLEREAAQALQAHAAERAQLRGQWKLLNELVSSQQQLLEREQLIQSLAEHRQALQPGAACPLCGALEHPAVARYEALDPGA